jgi:hypothetical protein
MQTSSPYDQDLYRNPANYAPLTPLSFLERAATVYPKRTSVIHGARRFTWQETYARCRRLASALIQHGIGKGDTVSAMLANTPSMSVSPASASSASGSSVRVAPAFSCWWSPGGSCLPSWSAGEPSGRSVDGSAATERVRSRSPGSTRSRAGSRTCATS